MADQRPARREGFGRAALLVGGLLGLLLTPPFALAYFLAYGAGERRPGWLEALRIPLRDLGLLGGDRVVTYNRYGLAYALALTLVIVGLVLLLRHHAASRSERAAGGLVVAGLGLAAVGTLLDYGFPDRAIQNAGFTLELVGYLIVIIAVIVVAIVLRARRRLTTSGALSIAVLGLVGIAVGSFAVGHIPSGPGAIVMLAAVVIGVRGVARSD